MPIYEYRCANCGYQFEQLQSISSERLRICPQCGKPALDKLVSATSFRLKGKGWYETDFKTKKPKPKSEETKSKPESPCEGCKHKADSGKCGAD